MLNYRIKKLSAALACSTCLMLPLQALAKDNDKDKQAPPPQHNAAPPVHNSTPPPNISHPPTGGGGGSGGQSSHLSTGANQFTPHTQINTAPSHPAITSSPSGGNHAPQVTHTPTTLPPRTNTLNTNTTHNTINTNTNHTLTTPHGPTTSNAITAHPPVGNTPQTLHNTAASNSLVKPAGPLVTPGGPLVHPAGPLVHPAGPLVGNAPAGHGPVVGTPLGQAGSQARIAQLNANRSNLPGINSRPLPAGAVTAHPNGGFTVATAHGAQLGVRPNGTIASFAGHGQTAQFAQNGRVAALHTQGMDIRNVNGARFITTQRPDHSLLVSVGNRGGYLERPYSFGGHAYLERSYAWGGHFYNRYFYPYRFHGLLFAGAIAAYYYAPHFYGWAYDPWAAPVAYNWGWRSAPWYGYYNGYFAPSPSYVDGATWLTDYSLSENLATAYDDSQVADAPPQDDAAPVQLGAVYSDAPPETFIAAPAASPITPELKAAITAEVRRQLAEEQAAAANPNAVSQGAQLQSALQAGNIFIVSSNLNASTPDQHNCVLTPGDTLQLQNTPGDNDTSAVLLVSSTKKGDCPVATGVQLTLQNLADMQNDLRMQIDAGLASLQENQGKNGLPPAPSDALAKPQAVVASNDSTSAADVQALLDAQRKQADQAEQQVSQSALSGT